MTIAFACPGCGKNYNVPDAMAGKRAKCKQCGSAVDVPGGAITAAPPPRPTARPAPRPMPREEAPTQEWQGDAEEAPRRKPAGSKRGLVLAGVVVLGLVLLTGASYGVYKMFFGSSGLSSDDLKFLPANSSVIASIRVADIMDSGTWKTVDEKFKLSAQMAKMEKDTGVSNADVAQVIVGAPLDKAEQHAVVIVRMKKAVDLKELISKTPLKDAFKETKVGNYTMHEASMGEAVGLCLVESKTIVFGPAAEVKAALERDKKPDFSEGMQKALKAADFSRTIVVAVNVKDVPSKATKNAGPLAPFVGAVEAAVFEIDITSQIKIQAAAVFNDSSKADDAKKLIDGTLAAFKPQLAQMGDLKDPLDNLSVSTSGSKLTVSTKFSVDPILKAVDQFGPMIEGMLGGGRPVGQPIRNTPPRPPQ